MKITTYTMANLPHVKGVDQRNVAMLNSIIDKANAGGGGATSQGLEFYMSMKDETNFIFFLTFANLSSGEEPELTSGETMQLMTWLDAWQKRVDMMASKAYEKGLNIAGLGFLYRWMLFSLSAAPNYFTPLLTTPNLYNVLLDKVEDSINYLIEHEKSFDGACYFYALFTVGMVIYLFLSTDPEWPSAAEMLSIGTPLMAIADKIIYDLSANDTIDSDKMLASIGIILFFLGSDTLFSDDSFLAPMDYQRFTIEHGGVLPWNFYAVTDDTGKVIKYNYKEMYEALNRNPYYLSSIRRVIDGEPGFEFKKSDPTRQDTFNWPAINTIVMDIYNKTMDN